MESIDTQVMNPWVSIWTKPRATIQQIVDTNPEHLVLLLAAIGGFSSVLDRASTRSLGDKLDWPVIFLIAAIVGPIAGIIALYIGSALIRWTGSWIGGKASSQTIRAAMAGPPYRKYGRWCSGFRRLRYLARKCLPPRYQVSRRILR